MLEHSPMFQLSLSAKELFHSNFLAWLLNEYSELIPALFSGTCEASAQDLEPLKDARVAREKNHLDLSCELAGGFLAIENKVKSVPTAAQLDRYAERWAPEKRVFPILLVIDDADLAVLRDTRLRTWHGMTYAALGKRLHDSIGIVREPYHRSLVEDWLKCIDGIASYAKIGDEWPPSLKGCPEGLHDLVWKRAAAKGAHAIVRGLGPDYQIDQGVEVLKQRSGTFNVYHGFTRGTGLFGFLYLFDPVALDAGVGLPVGIGMQVQAGTLKSYVEFQVDPRSKDLDRAALRAAAKRLFDRLLAAAAIPEWGGETMKRGLNTYSETYFYRTNPIRADSTIDSLAGQMVEAARAIVQAGRRAMGES